MIEITAPAAARHGWQSRFPALTYPNYRLWFIGQVVAAFGMWMQSTAQGYLVFELTQSPAYLGYVSFASGIPTWLFTLYGGVIADRMARRTLMLVTQACMMTLALILAALTLLHLIQPWHILVLAFLLGIVNAFDMPARQAFTLEMVERRDLANAVALNSTMFNLATTTGPAVAGIIYKLVGPGLCFLLNGVTFIGMISILLLLKVKPLATPSRGMPVLFALREGLNYVWHQPVVRSLMVIAGLISLFGMSFATLIPAWAVEVLGGDATTNGLLYSARGVGALIGALWIASLGRFMYKGRLLTAAFCVAPIMILVFSQVRWLPLSLLVLVGTGLTFIPVVNLANALVQTHTPDELRGRVMGIYNLIFAGMWPLGGLWVGIVAQGFGAPTAVLVGGVILGISAIGALFLFPRLRALE